MTSPDPTPANAAELDQVVHAEHVAQKPVLEASALGPAAVVGGNAPKEAKVRPSQNGNGTAKSTLASVVIALFVITFVVQAFQIPSGSMEKTLLIGDYVLVDKVHLAGSGVWSKVMPYREIRRGDIIVFHYPVDPEQHFVKRAIGLPGDRVRLREGVVFINGEPLHEDYAIHTARSFDYFRDNFPIDMDTTGNMNRAWHSALTKHVEHSELVVPSDMYFVMGDNRDQSSDSRYWGFVPRQAIVGQPLIVYLSLKDQSMSGLDDSNDKLVRSARVLSHFWQFARWKRMFHLIR
jgi:signal peptidase I